jgi:two-component system sensor histidine kinase/response regulator
MSSVNDSSSSTPQWFVYFVTITLGIAFTVTLVSIAWNNALKEAERGFSLGSQLIKESVGRNARVAHNTVNSVAAFFAANPNLSRRQFSVITQSLFAEHSFMQGAVYCRYERSGARADDGSILGIASGFKLHQVAMRGGKTISSCSDIFRSKGGYVDMLQELFSSNKVQTIASPKIESENENDYWLLKGVRGGDGNGRILGFVATLIDTRTLLGSEPGDTSLSIILVSDTASLMGRQLLFQKAEGGNVDYPVSELKEETVTQFPSYSIKLDIGKHIPLADVDKELIYNALLIGIGITLLIGALVRAKDVQERQLRERNVLIEKKVEEQTMELARARDHALDASKVKSDFLASMSHEIRTPLNAIIGMAELLGETSLSVEQKKYTNIFKKAGDTLLSLVNDILDLSKIEAGRLVLEEIEFDLSEILEESIEIYALKAAEKNIELLCDIDPDVNYRRIGDPARLRQIILNLISNALKFTDSGEIVVSVINEPEASDSDNLRISVRDTGIGIPSAKADTIFNSFTQVDSSTTRKYGGTGLGLTICRSLVEMMHGRIWVESGENRGSQFIFTVPLPPSEREPTIVPRPVRLDQKRILVVDDNATARNLLRARLEAAKADVVTAANGKSAIQLFKEGDPFDLVLTDYRMPEMDGLELAKEIKALDPKHIVLLMTDSAHLNQSIKDVSMHGIDGYVVKPVKHSELLKQIAYSLNRKSGESSEAESITPAESTKTQRILLVDDNPDNRMLVKEFLKKFPYEVDEAENGEQALEKFQEGVYDLVLMDVQMPVMDGRSATRKIRAWETQEGRTRTSIVALTAHAIKEEINECLQAGCDAHLSKPVKKTKLIETIQEFTQ